MLTLKTKNREFVDLINGLFKVQDLQGVRFGLVVSKNIRILQQELKDLEEASLASPEFIELSQKVNSLGEDTEAIAKLEVESTALVEERKKQLEEIDKMMEESIEIKLHSIKEDILPENITASQITSIDKLIK
jgi:small-conductance mechanosensitive channel